MQIRRPLVALLAALALFGGGATMTACGSPTTPNEGTTDDEGGGEGVDEGEEGRESPNGGLPNNSDPEDSGDLDDDTTDPD